MTVYWSYYSGDTTLTLRGDAQHSGSYTKHGYFDNTPSWTSGGDVPWYNYRSQITTVNIDSSFSVGKFSYWFCGCSNLTTINNPSNMNISGATSARFTFWNCSSLTSIPWEVPASITNMFKTFYGCTNLEGILTIKASPTDITECFLGTTKTIHLLGDSSTNFSNTSSLAQLANTSTAGNVDYYEPPKVTITGSRNSSTATIVDLTITASKASWTSFSGVTPTINVSPSGASYGTISITSVTDGVWSVTHTGASENVAFTYEITVSDKYENVTLGTSGETRFIIPTGFKIIHFLKGGKSIGFGTAAAINPPTNGQLTFAMDANFTGHIKADDDWYIEARKVLWTNPNPTSSFGSGTSAESGTTISNSDITDYLLDCDEIEITFILSTSYLRWSSSKAPVDSSNSTKCVMSSSEAHVNTNAVRVAVIDTPNKQIIFGGASNGSTYTNNYIIPQQIIGIKHK